MNVPASTLELSPPPRTLACFLAFVCPLKTCRSSLNLLEHRPRKMNLYVLEPTNGHVGPLVVCKRCNFKQRPENVAQRSRSTPEVQHGTPGKLQMQSRPFLTLQWTICFFKESLYKRNKQRPPVANSRNVLKDLPVDSHLYGSSEFLLCAGHNY